MAADHRIRLKFLPGHRSDSKVAYVYIGELEPIKIASIDRAFSLPTRYELEIGNEFLTVENLTDAKSLVASKLYNVINELAITSERSELPLLKNQKKKHNG